MTPHQNRIVNNKFPNDLVTPPTQILSISPCTYSSCSGFCITINKNSLSGATIISWFLLLSLKNVSSSVGSSVRATLAALAARRERRAEYWSVWEGGREDRIAVPEEFTIRTPRTPRWEEMRERVDSTSDRDDDIGFRCRGKRTVRRDLQKMVLVGC